MDHMSRISQKTFVITAYNVILYNSLFVRAATFDVSINITKIYDVKIKSKIIFLS
jgi:hypothetical protein